MSWTFVKVWNESLEKPDARVLEPRDYLWASELGKPMTDVYLRMKGTPYTNPPNPRSLRKFEAGSIWEWIVEVILLRAGIMQDSQTRVEHTYDGLLRVSGKIDFIAGGKPDFEKGKAELHAMRLPERTMQAIDNIIAYLAKEYPDGLEKKALEVKSISSHMMNVIEQTERALQIHRLQAYHYTKHADIQQADIIYICRDDCRMMSIPVIGGAASIEDEYHGYIEKMTKVFEADELPEKEQPIVFDEDQCRFSLNRAIGWSPYLTLLYGFESQLDFENEYGKIPASWNRVLTRMKKGEKMTANNEGKLEEMRAAGYKPEELVPKLVDNAEEEVEE